MNYVNEEYNNNNNSYSYYSYHYNYNNYYNDNNNKNPNILLLFSFPRIFPYYGIGQKSMEIGFSKRFSTINPKYFHSMQDVQFG